MPPQSSGYKFVGEHPRGNLWVRKIFYPGTLMDYVLRNGKDPYPNSDLTDERGHGMAVASLLAANFDDKTSNLDPFKKEASMHNIMQSCFAGNRGAEMTRNVMSWVGTTAASTELTHIFTKLSWGSEPDQFLKGHSINRFLMKEYHELVIWSGRLNTGDVKNQIVVFSNCTNEEKAKTAAKYFQENGAAGIVVIANRNTWFYNLDCPLPAVSLSEEQGNKFKILVNEAKNEKKELYARIHETEEVPAEKIYVADFSSRGHNPSSAHIAKPDFTAPGRLLCCAKLQEKTDDGRQCYKLGFGTSYAAPIAGGGMLALKANHSTWTESMIKSAFGNVGFKSQSFNMD